MEAAPTTYVAGEQQRDGTIILRSSVAQQLLAAPRKMEPGKVYVAKLPGRSRPSFIRRSVQPPKLRSGFSAGTEQLVPYASPRSRSVEPAPQEIRVVSAPVPPTYAIAPSQQQLQLEHAGAQGTAAPQQPVVFVHAPPSHVAPPSAPAPLVLEKPQPSSTVTAHVATHHGRRHDVTLQHTCASCGKFRSPSYHHRHPLAPDEVPKLGICRKCMKVQTSSDESTDDGSRSRSRDSRRNKRLGRKKKHRERHIRSSSEERPPSVEEVIRVTRRTESRGSRGRRRSESRGRRLSPSESEGQPRLQVSYLPARTTKVEPPAERVHVVERIRYIEAPGHGRSRSESRAREVYEEDNEYVRAHRHAHQRRPVKFISYRQDDDGHIIEEYRPKPSRHFSPRRPDMHNMQHEEAYYPRELEHRHRPRRISYEQIREPSRSSRDSFEHVYYAEMPSRPPSRSVRVLRVHDRGPEDAIRDSWESDFAEVRPPRVMFVPSEHTRPHSPVERHISEDVQPIRRRRRRVRDVDDLILDRRSELSHLPEAPLPPRTYRDVRVPTPPPAQSRPQIYDRYLSPPPPAHRARHVPLDYMLDRVRLSPSLSPPPTRGRRPSRARSLSRSHSASAFWPPFYRHVSGDGTEEGEGVEPVGSVRLRESVTNPEDWEWGIGELPVREREAASWEGARWVRG